MSTNRIFKRISSIINKFKYYYRRRNSRAFVAYLRSLGITIGENCVFRDPLHTRIDVTRPALISIGDNVDINMHFQILTHDWTSHVFKEVYHDFVNSSGKVEIGDNVYIATNVCVFKGVRIGNNCIIGGGSVVTHDIPDNSVAAGCPCKVICSLEEYYQKRKKQGLAEAVEYVNCFIERFGRNPLPHEMTEEFIYFVNADNVEEYERQGVPVQKRLGNCYASFLNCPPPFQSFNEFVAYCISHKNHEL